MPGLGCAAVARRRRRVGLPGLSILLLALGLAIPGTATSQLRPGTAPSDAWTCPASHPIKGNFTTYSGERCIYHVPGGQFYAKTKPERCYATGDEARKDGCRASKR